MPFPELAALRAATSTNSFKPAEEQFIEQTPWANPQHPSHAHALQHQSLGQQPMRVSSPFSASSVAQARRHSHQHAVGTPISGTFSGTTPLAQAHTNGLYMSGGRNSPMNPFANPSFSHKAAPSPLGSRHPSMSPQQSKLQSAYPDQSQRQDNQQDDLVGGPNHNLFATKTDALKESRRLSNEGIVRPEIDRTVRIKGQA